MSILGSKVAEKIVFVAVKLKLKILAVLWIDFSTFLVDI